MPRYIITQYIDISNIFFSIYDWVHCTGVYHYSFNLAHRLMLVEKEGDPGEILREFLHKKW